MQRICHHILYHKKLLKATSIKCQFTPLNSYWQHIAIFGDGKQKPHLDRGMDGVTRSHSQ